jgi:hypothetical protein
VKANIDSVHPQPSHEGHLVDGVLVGAPSLWPKISTYVSGLPMCVSVHT